MTAMNRVFANVANLMNSADASVRRDVIVNTMASELKGVSREDIKAYVNSQLESRDRAVSDYDFGVMM